VEEETGETYHQCNDSSYCLSRRSSQAKQVEVTVHG
jgi:hypothetical protein